MGVVAGIGVKFGPLPSDLMWSRYVFLVNVLVKMLLWIFVIRPPSRVTSTAQPGVAHMNRDLREMRRRRRVKHRAILYVGASDSVIFLTYVMVYFAENFYLERHYELEERVLVSHDEQLWSWTQFMTSKPSLHPLTHPCPHTRQGVGR